MQTGNDNRMVAESEANTKLYMVRKRLWDRNNSIEMFAGTILETAETGWVARHGSLLEPLDRLPKYYPERDVVYVAGTKEGVKGQATTKDAPKEKEVSSEQENSGGQTSQRRRRRRTSAQSKG